MFTKKIYEQRDGRLFQGFYGSYVDSASWESAVRQDYEDEAEAVDKIINSNGFWNKYEIMVANKQVALWSEALEPHKDIINNLKLHKVWHPREYNFMTDMLEVECEVDIKKLHQFCKRRKQKFNQYLWDVYHRRDGFIPFFHPSYDGVKNRDECDSLMIDFMLVCCTKFKEETNDQLLYDYSAELCPWDIINYEPA